MSEEVMLSVVGSFIGIGLTINAFFLKGILSELSFVKIEIAKLSTRSESKEERLDKLEANEKEIFERLNKLEKQGAVNELCHTR